MSTSCSPRLGIVPQPRRTLFGGTGLIPERRLDGLGDQSGVTLDRASVIRFHHHARHWFGPRIAHHDAAPSGELAPELSYGARHLRDGLERAFLLHRHV